MIKKIKKISKKMLDTLTFPYYRMLYKRGDHPKIIILGNQKTGSSAIASILAEKAEYSKQIDLPGGDGRKCVKKKIDLQTYINFHPKYFTKDLLKENELTFIHNELKNIFPNSTYVFIVRHPMDNIRSILDRVGIEPQSLPLSFSDIKSMKIDYAWKIKLLGEDLIINKGLNLPETLAYRWRRAAQVYINDMKNFKLVKYEKFNSNKKETIENLLKELNLKNKKLSKGKYTYHYQPKGNNRGKTIYELFSEEIIREIEKYCEKEMKILNYKFYSKKEL